eukprot:TRINITY_DN48143_c0_g1_i1.p1 TRINITY_DN48143_c0_g1~~TRINITY_DN48143_c0_g1_i1.p1  ORF type:complete len:507 (-),score=123.38 TRINITY_DN48143_c0_g1_i1:80-1600(-)
MDQFPPEDMSAGYPLPSRSSMSAASSASFYRQDLPPRLAPGGELAAAASEAANQPAPIACGPVLQQLLAEECSASTARALEPHASVLLNLVDLLIGSTSGEAAVGEASFRALLRFMEVTMGQLNHFRAKAERYEQTCTALQFQLQQEREGRNEDGFKAAISAREQQQVLQAERQLRGELEARLRSLDSQLAYSSGIHNRQAMELQSMTRCFAEAEIGLESKLREEVRRQEDLLKEEHRREVERLEGELERRAAAARSSDASASRELEAERSASAAHREEAARLEAALGPWRALIAARMPCVVELSRFLCEESRELAQVTLPTRAWVPVLALEWPPHTPLEIALTWPAVAAGGTFALLSALCEGQLAPDALELTACCVDGRWIGALHGEVEASRLAALLAFQALRPDVAIRAACRVVPMRRPLLPKGVLEMDPSRRHAAPVGGPRGVPANGLVTPPGPETGDEDRIRSLIRGCPLEREVLLALCYVRAAHPEAIQRPQPQPLRPLQA